MKPKLFVFVRLHAAPGSENTVVTALHEVVAASRSEPGCVSIEAFRATRDERLFFIYSVWRDTEAFDRHAALSHTTSFMATVDPLLDEPREVHRTTALKPS